jgi:phage shock protein C
VNAFSDGKPLVRLREGRMVAGVCAGLGIHFGLDVNLVRLVFAALSIFGGMGVLLYLIAWVVIPEEGERASIAENFITKNRAR